MTYKWDAMSESDRNRMIAIEVMGMSRDDFEFLWPAMLNYSTAISDAWKVVEKFGIAIIPQSSESLANMKYMAMIESTKIDRSDGIREFAATAPEAICKVALKIVGIEIE